VTREKKIEKEFCLVIDSSYVMSSPLLRSPVRRGRNADIESADECNINVQKVCCRFVIVTVIAAFAVSICVWTLATVTRRDVHAICSDSLLWWYVVASLVLSILIMLPLIRAIWITDNEGERRMLWFMVACLCVIECVWGYCELLLRGCDFALLPNGWLYAIGLVFVTICSCVLLFTLYRLLMLWYLR
jgi:hypothetical protein